MSVPAHPDVLEEAEVSVGKMKYCHVDRELFPQSRTKWQRNNKCTKMHENRRVYILLDSLEDWTRGK